MVPKIIADKIDTAAEKWTLVFIIVFVLAFLLYLLFEYRFRKIQMTWYAISILRDSKEAGIPVTNGIVKQALKGDFTEKLPV